MRAACHTYDMFLVFFFHSAHAVNECAVLNHLDVGIVGSRTVRGMNVFFSVLILWGEGRYCFMIGYSTRSQWPRGLRRRSGAACLLRLRVRITPGRVEVSATGVFCVCV
jgi:hypothetical protein